MKGQNTLFSSKSDEWATPKKLFEELNNEFHFTIDLCSTDENALCKKHYTKLKQLNEDLDGEVIFCNPPYSEIKKWVEICKNLSSKNKVIMLIPARTDTRWFHDYIYKKCEIRFIKGRLHFNDGKGSAPFPSMIIIF